MAIKMQKVALVFHHTMKMKFNDNRADMFDKVINSLNVDTVTQVDFTKVVRATKFHL